MDETTVLDLTIEEIVPERPRVKLPDGNEYEMRLPQEFGIEDQLRMRRVAVTVQRIADGEAEDLSEEEINQLDRSLARFIMMLLPDVPSEVRNALSDRQRIRLMMHFQSFMQATRGESETPSDTPPSSPNSNGSTVETPRTG